MRLLEWGATLIPWGLCCSRIRLFEACGHEHPLLVPPGPERVAYGNIAYLNAPNQLIEFVVRFVLWRFSFTPLPNKKTGYAQIYFRFIKSDNLCPVPFIILLS